MIKKLLLSLLLVPSMAHAGRWAGKLDLPQNPDAVIAREFHDGNWVAGGQEQIWHLEYNGREVFHVSLAVVSRTDGTDTAFGPMIGLPIGSLGQVLQNLMTGAAPELSDHAKFLKTLGDWISLEGGMAWRPVHGADVHETAWLIGAKARVPISTVSNWLVSGL